MPPPQFRVHTAPAVLEQLRSVILRAASRGRGAEAMQAARKIDEGMRWLADELGESRYPLAVFGELRVVVIGPIGAVFAVNTRRLEVHVGRFVLMGPDRRG